MSQIFVTGAVKQGIGEATTRKLLSLGHSVIGTCEKGESAQSPIVDPRFRLMEVDHSDRSALTELCAKIKNEKFDGFVNCQMYFSMEDQTAFSHSEWDRSLFVNMSMPNFFVRQLRSQFNTGASIVMISSTEAFMGSFGASSYASTKAAVHNLVKTWANLFGEKNVRANAVAAGWIGGVMDTDEVFNLSKQITPLRRLGSPNEVAEVVHFLLSPASSFVNGSVITADGGYSGVDRISQFEFDAASK